MRVGVPVVLQARGRVGIGARTGVGGKREDGRGRRIVHGEGSGGLYPMTVGVGEGLKLSVLGEITDKRRLSSDVIMTMIVLKVRQVTVV
jgi:hypothetical protein